MGPVEKALQADLERVDVAVQHSAKAATALVLARTLDEGAGLSTAAVARELRAVLSELLMFAEVEESRVDDLAKRRSSRKAEVAKRSTGG